MSRKRKQQPGTSFIGKFIGMIILAACLASVLWSMWVDTLLPLIRAGDLRALVFNLLGLPLILVGVGIFVYGGLVFVRNTFDSYQDETLLESMATIRVKPSRESVRAARWQTLRIFWRAWKPGLAWLALGFLVIALGGFLINL